MWLFVASCIISITYGIFLFVLSFLCHTLSESLLSENIRIFFQAFIHCICRIVEPEGIIIHSSCMFFTDIHYINSTSNVNHVL